MRGMRPARALCAGAARGRYSAGACDYLLQGSLCHTPRGFYSKRDRLNRSIRRPHFHPTGDARALTVDAENFDAIPDKFGALVTASLTATI